MYQLKEGFKGIFRIADEVWVPNDPLNYDWRQYQEWLEAGNEPLPAE